MTRQCARAWTALDDQVLRALHGQGRGVTYIATFMVSGRAMIHRRARALGLSFDDRHQWTPAEIAQLRARYPDEVTADLARDLGVSVSKVHQRAKKLGLYKSAAYHASDKTSRIQRGRTDPRFVATQFKKGLVPANKGLRRPGWSSGRMVETQFKKGRPASEARNYVPIGTEKIDPKRKVLMRKITDDPALFPVNRWRPVHVLVWEGVHGPVPPGHIVIFKRDQKTFVAADITIDRLELVTLAENMRRNSFRTNFPPELVQLVQLRGALNRKINRLSKDKP